MSLIPLTKVDTVLNEDAENRLRDMEREAFRIANSDPDSTPEPGSYEWFVENSITPPEDLEPSRKPMEMSIKFYKKDFDKYECRIRLNTVYIEEMEEAEDEDDWTTIYLKSGRQIMVKEDLEQIDKLLTKYKNGKLFTKRIWNWISFSAFKRRERGV